MVVMLGELVETTTGMWLTRPPARWPSVYLLGPGDVVVGQLAVRWCVGRPCPAIPRRSGCPDAVGHVRIGAIGCVGIGSTDVLELRVDGDRPTRRQGHRALTGLAARRAGRRRRRRRGASNRCCVVGCQGGGGQSGGECCQSADTDGGNCQLLHLDASCVVMVISGCSPASGPRPGGPRGASTSPASPRAPGAP